MKARYEDRHGTAIQNRGGITGDAVLEEGHDGVGDVPTIRTMEAASNI